MVRPKAVTLDEISRHGSLPTVAPVKPYTELALIYYCFREGIQVETEAEVEAERRGKSSHLESQLAAIQHGALERVCLFLQISLGLLSRSKQVF
jgi:hypothetical protein